MSEQKKLSPMELLKLNSNGLRGTLKESLDDDYTGSLRPDDQLLIKFHGLYQQDDRDRREIRSEKKLEWLYSFMIRLRLPGGFMTPDQWLALHHIAGEHSTGVIKITTRQTLQLHGLLKSKIKPTIQAFNTVQLDSIAACGDVNRNVTCSAHPAQSPVHDKIFAYADKLSLLALPKTRAYYEIWLDEAPLAEKTEEDPLYQERYLPRKFKMAIAIPPDNDVDVFANDMGWIAIIENGALQGFNIAVGGGMGTTHGNTQTYPRLATVLGFCPDNEEKLLKVAYEVLTIQRDFGNRNDRKLSRLKYTVDSMGVEAFKAELERRCGFRLEKERKYHFTQRKDHYGWYQNHEKKWYYTVFVENGRITDEQDVLMKTALYEIAQTGKANFRFTTNQHAILSDIPPENKQEIEAILEKYHLHQCAEQASELRKNAMACVAFNTCPLALAEGQRYLPSLVSKIEPILKKYNLDNDSISLRMTGCPNGCARPHLAEIGFVGTAYGKYNLHLGGDRMGTRLNIKYKENLDETAILQNLDELFERYSLNKTANETFGDFIVRNNIV